MIKINLAKKKSINSGDQMTELKERTKTFIGFLDRFKLGAGASAENSDTRGPIIRLVVGVALCFLADSYVEDLKQQEIDKLNVVLNRYQKEQREAKAEVDKIKNFEPIKKQLEEYENILTKKLDVVQELMASRANSIKVLFALSSSLPTDVWVKGLRKNKDELIITGGALEFNYVSDFMKKLSENVFFGNVQPRYQKNEITGNGVQFVSFELQVRQAHGQH